MNAKVFDLFTKKPLRRRMKRNPTMDELVNECMKFGPCDIAMIDEIFTDLRIHSIKAKDLSKSRFSLMDVLAVYLYRKKAGL